ncbi:MAG TPA: hypothetical protein VNB90_13635 [Cytophagaceae bacterium]|jgi:outer membrane biosynthesis protein TonB|nr:hypothetical protein [Cytophagaceae bacterium]
MVERKDENKNKSIGLIVTLGVHAALLLVLFFVIAWRPPYPDISGNGLAGGSMEINLGVEDFGTGDIQTNNDQQQNEQTPEEEIQEEVTDEAIVNEEKVVTSENESPYEVKAEKEQKEKKEAAPKKEVVEARNTFPNKPNSESDGNGKVKGDQGKPEGNPDSRNMFPGGRGNGTGGGIGDGPGGNGASLDLPGWDWDTKPNKVDPTSESGYVLFEFYIDEEGSVISAKKIGGANLTPSEDNFYKKQLLETSFHLKDSRAKPAPKTRGVFRFEVRSR